MKTTVGKVFAVITMAASLIFLGFVVVATGVGGPNWEREAQNIPGYTFTFTPGENPQWSGRKHVGEGSLPSARNIEPVIAAAYDDMIRTDQEAMQKPDQEIPLLEQQIKQYQDSIKSDSDAMNARADQVRAHLLKKREEVEAVAQQVGRMADEVQKKEQQIQSRREDVNRLQAQLQELRTDRFRIQQIQQQLQDLIQQIDGSLASAGRRAGQLEGYGPKVPAAKPEPPGGTN
jgi:HAMP domain-containing protein